ncbi:MAG: sigma-54 dependent transcriptional regulator [Burkholderiales bacterium]
MSVAVLIVEDEVTLAKNMRMFLDREGFETEAAYSGEEGLRQVEVFRPDVILLDYSLPKMTGLDVLEALGKTGVKAKVVMITGRGSTEVAVKAMKMGASDYLSKPIALSELRLVINRLVGDGKLENTISYYREKEARESGLARLIGGSPALTAIKGMIERLIRAEATLVEGAPPAVLITGETGTGKELAARALHFDGSRSKRPFVEVNCASIPAALLEAELFGYEKGAFTDAKQRKIGLVEAADGGTIFLDEIGEVDAAAQVKLLKLIEEKTVRRVGGLRENKVDIRVIAATNRNLEAMVRDGLFRSDLFFRLRIVQISMPPLRARDGDIVDLARRFLADLGARYGRPGMIFSPEAEKELLAYSWPGNVRELRNAIEQTIFMAPGTVVEPIHLTFCRTLETPIGTVANSAKITESGRDQFRETAPTLEQLEKRMVAEALHNTAGNVTRAAKLLGLSRDTLRYRMEKYGLTAPRM